MALNSYEKNFGTFYPFFEKSTLAFQPFGQKRAKKGKKGQKRQLMIIVKFATIRRVKNILGIDIYRPRNI